jgi:hypothetical protein
LHKRRSHTPFSKKAAGASIGFCDLGKEGEMKKLIILFALAAAATSLATRAGVAAPGHYSCRDIQDFGATRYDEHALSQFFGAPLNRVSYQQLEDAMYDTKHCIYNRKVETGMGSSAFGNPPRRSGTPGGGDVGSAIIGGIFGAIVGGATGNQNQGNQNQEHRDRNPRGGPRDHYMDQMVETARRIENLMYQWH